MKMYDILQRLLTKEREVVPFGCAVTNCIVHSGRENSWSQYTYWQLTEHLSPEVGTNLVHSIVGFTQKHWSLIWENENDILNSIETENHDDEEKGAISILNSSQVLTDLCKKNNAEASCQKCHNELDVTCLRKS